MTAQQSVAKSDDYEIRATLVRALLAAEIPRSDIRHEITLETASSMGRADLLLVRDGRLTGFEIKSARDTLGRCEAQERAYRMAFDRAVLLADRQHLPREDGKITGPWSNTICYEHGTFTQIYGGKMPDLLTHRFYESDRTSAMRMLSLLWANEIKTTAGSTTRHRAIHTLAETMSLKDIRRLTVAALRTRSLNRWEEAFWRRFDAESSRSTSAQKETP